MKGLLITNDFPPITGGEATYYARICGTVPATHAMVLAPQLPGAPAYDVTLPYRVIRRRVPISPHPLARLVQIIVFFWSAFFIVLRDRVERIHIGHLYLGVIGLGLKRLLNVPYVVYLHGGEMAPYMRFRLVRAVTRAVVRNAHRVVVNSDFTRRHFEAMGMHHREIVVLQMSVDTMRFRPGLDDRHVRARYGLDGAKVILTVGRVIERKGHDVVLEALRDVEQAVGPVHYLIVGSGPEELRLRALAQDLGCAHAVSFTGHLSAEELPYVYAACDVFVMPSRALAGRDGVEGFGIAFLEASACGKPVIGAHSGGIAEAVLDGTTGILVDSSSVRAVTDALTHLLAHQEEAYRLGVQGRHHTEGLESAWVQTLHRIWDVPDGGT